MAIDVNPISQTDSIVISTDSSANLDDTIKYAQEALASSVSSANSSSQSSIYATNSFNSANTSTAQAVIATAQASNALESANNADTSESNAETYMINASTYATNSYNSSVASATSEANADISEANALSYRNSANDSASTATTKAGEASTSASNASTSESNALSYKNTTQGYMTTTEGYKNNASTSASNALSSENKANQWANADLGVEVETGLYSAKHWAIKAIQTCGGIAIDDEAVNEVSTWSSQTISNRVEQIEDEARKDGMRILEIDATINTLLQYIAKPEYSAVRLVLSCSNCAISAMVYDADNGNYLHTTPPLTVVSSDTTVIDVVNGELQIKRADTYFFMWSIEFTYDGLPDVYVNDCQLFLVLGNEHYRALFSGKTLSYLYYNDTYKMTGVFQIDLPAQSFNTDITFNGGYIDNIRQETGGLNIVNLTIQMLTKSNIQTTPITTASLSTSIDAVIQDLVLDDLV